jgi:S1-C subfamily serine protease
MSGSMYSRKLMYVNYFFITALIASSVFFAYSHFNIQTKLSQSQTQISDLQKQFQSVQNQFEDSQRQLQIVLQQLQNLNWSTDSLPLPQIYDMIKDSVVLISTNLGEGSGFVYNIEGYIITNNHVIEGATSMQVTFIDGNITAATVVGTDPYSDLAIIKVNISPEQLHPVLLGNSSNLVVGESIIAIGSPFGLSDSMTSGIVSALGRELSATGGYTIIDVIQVDAAINPGNSGGPLVNMYGEVVGVNSAIVSQTGEFSGVGFAIPSDTVKREIPSLIANGDYVHPYLGISGLDVNLAIAERLGLNKVQGFLIMTIVEDGPAEEAGLRGGTETVTIDGQQIRIGGDIIIGVDNINVRKINDLVVYLERNKRPNDTISLKVIRNQIETTVKLTLGERPQP